MVNVITYDPATQPDYIPDGTLVELSDNGHENVEPGLEFDGVNFSERVPVIISDDEMIESVQQRFRSCQASMFVGPDLREQLRLQALSTVDAIKGSQGYETKRALMESGLQKLGEMALVKTGG